MFDIFPAKLLFSKRGSVVDEEYFGFAFLYKNFSLVKKFGNDNNAPFYLRSLSKPIQASFIVDFNLELTSRQIAVACGSHCGTSFHIDVVKSILEKFQIDEKFLKCPAIEPLDTKDFSGLACALHNNCSGKHALMLAICKVNNWDLEDYLDFNHPLQKLIYKRHLEFSGAKDAQISLDGCNAPVFALKIDEIARMFFNFFNNNKFDIIKNSIVENPYTYGGNNRLDSEIVTLGENNLVSKVGAGGFVIAYNIAKDEMLIIKMSQNNNEARRIIALCALNEMNWIKNNPAPAHICTESGITTGALECNFSFL